MKVLRDDYSWDASPGWTIPSTGSVIYYTYRGYTWESRVFSSATSPAGTITWPIEVVAS
jgi:hypothetical protein